MNKRIVAGILWILIGGSVPPMAADAKSPPPGLRLEGTFIQYQDWMKTLDADAWRREMEAMRRAKMNLVIVQWLQHNPSRFLPDDPKAIDPTRVLLEYSDRHNMRVFVGLAADEEWWRKSTQPDYLDRAAAESIRIAEEAWRRYGRHRSFAGWYLPQETWDSVLDDSRIAYLRAFFRRISDRCKALSGGKPVATAPFFAGNVRPDVVEQIYTRLLDGAGLDILMLQDGVGARGWEENVEVRVIPYFRAFRNACLANGVELWSDLESFRLVQKQPVKFAPADAERLVRQLAAEAPFVRRFVTFDFFHYMSPHRGAAQKRLYEDYLRRCVDREFLPIFGRSLEMDPLFPYYQGRTPASIAAEIRANGYSIVRYILTADSNVNPALIEALRREGIGVWYATFGNGTYTTKDLPEGWPEWKMVTRSDLAGTPLADGYTRLCLNHPAYRAWKKRQIGQMLRRYPFVGVDIMEPHWPEYPGPQSPAYACFCARCRDAFRRMFPQEEALPDILHPDSPRAPERNPQLWQKWLAFRQASLTDFLNDLVNGKGGIRETAPRAKVCTWTLALGQPDGVRRVREDSGEDAAEIVRTVGPDLHCLQTHWPDWIRADLPPDYVERYRPFLEGIRAIAPNLPLMIQADTGSQKQNRRDWEWIEAFERACAKLGVGGTTFYEYFIGQYMYIAPPRIAEVRRHGESVELRFTKRLDPATAGEVSRYSLSSGRIVGARVDGSVVILSVEGMPSGETGVLTVRGIADAADRRLFNDHPPAVLDSQRVAVSRPALSADRRARAR